MLSCTARNSGAPAEQRVLEKVFDPPVIVRLSTRTSVKTMGRTALPPLRYDASSIRIHSDVKLMIVFASKLVMLRLKTFRSMVITAGGGLPLVYTRLTAAADAAMQQQQATKSIRATTMMCRAFNDVLLRI
jgi:hypothetical protein